MDIAEATEIPAAPQPSRRRRNLIVGGAVIIAAAAGIAIGVSASSGPGTITVHGSIALGPTAAGDSTDPSGATDGDPCLAVGGYTDISQGTTVTIGGAGGQTLAVAGLGAGREADVDDSLGVAAGNCVFPFTAQVPAGQSAYTVTISHRGTTTFTPAQAQSGMNLTLGN